jgi:hypothetical protein
MNGGVYLIHGDGRLIEMVEQAYDSEDLLQELLAKYPSLLAGSQMDSEKPRRWLLVCREAQWPSEEDGASRWSVDHLFLDQDGIPTLVEVKRSSDTRIRREVVGQMLDYAANAVVYWPCEEIRSRFQSRCEKLGRDAETEMNEFLAGEIDPGKFWDLVKTNLQTGRIRMLFVADEIPTELRRIVEFLNEQMKNAEVLAVEIKQFEGHGLRTLVPRVIGQTAEAERAKSSSGRGSRQWDEHTLFQELETKNGAEVTAVARKILDWAKGKMTRISWGRGSQSGSFVPILEHQNKEHQLFAVWSYGAVEIYFYWYQYKKPFDTKEKREELLRRLNQIPGVSLPAEAILKRPNIPLSVLKDESALEKFLQVFDWVVSEIKST